MATDTSGSELDMSGQDERGASNPDEAVELAALARSSLADLVDAARQVALGRIAPDGRSEPTLLDAYQHELHGLAWLGTYATVAACLEDWARRLDAEGQWSELESLLLRVVLAEYLAQVRGGIPMSQGEYARLADLGVAWQMPPALARLVDEAAPAARMKLVELMLLDGLDGNYGALGQSEDLRMIRDSFRRFVEAEVLPHAHGWHLRDELMPAALIGQLSELGVFGLTIPEEHGGLGLSKEAMVVVSEELSRGYIGVGSLGTRSEIAAELILAGGTSDQKARWLPMIAGGVVLPTAVFTEPDTGSDLGSLRTRAERVEGGWTISGEKTWITHAARAGLMTVLARTDKGSRDHRGLSMFLAEKLPADETGDFPSPGITGSEIPVIGYRGMKEYELSFDGFAVPDEALLGTETGQGFRQLMSTFESARIQTAARAVGVAQSALDYGFRYACERQQFGRPIVKFPRIAGKLALAAAEIMAARQLTYYSAQRKDAGHRCDLEAGMAKLLAARVAWTVADNMLQVHGGNGFAQEFPISRILCDARILNIFEGAGEIQAQVVARRMLETPSRRNTYT